MPRKPLSKRGSRVRHPFIAGATRVSRTSPASSRRRRSSPRRWRSISSLEWEKRVPWDLLRKGSQLGFRTFVLQEENGGSGMSDHLTSCLVAEELAAGELGTAYYFMLTARRARDWFELRMTPEQKAYFIPKFVGDDLYFTTVAIHEPETDFGFDYFTETPDNVRLEHARRRAAGRLVDHQRNEGVPDGRIPREADRHEGADAGRRAVLSRRGRCAGTLAAPVIEARTARRRQRGRDPF